jgi:hypothetical protein
MPELMNWLPSLLVILLLQNAPGPGVVDGIVVKAGTEEPIADVTIEVTGIADRPAPSQAGTVFSLRARTDRAGRFRVGNVPAGSAHQLIAVRFPEFVTAQYGQRSPSLPGSPITVKAGEQLRGLRVEMTPSGSISGRVVDQNGRGVRTEIRAIRPWYIGSSRILAESIPSEARSNISARTSSDANGRYRLEGLSPGQYYVVARSGFPNAIHSYHPRGAGAADALPIEIRPGTVAANTDLQVKRAARRSIKGIVIPDPGVSIWAVEAMVAVRGQPPESAPMPFFARNGAQFQISVPAAGEYDLYIRATTESNQSWWGRSTITIADNDERDIKDLQVRVFRSFDIPGRVSLEADSPPSAARFNYSALTFDLQPRGAGMPNVHGVTVGADGVFGVQAVAPGDYRIGVSPILAIPAAASPVTALQNAYVQSVRLGNQDVLNDGLRVQSTVPDWHSGFHVVVSLRGGMVDGRILDEKRTPVPHVRAVIVPDAARHSRHDLYRSALTDEAGRFQLRGIPPGDYRLFSWESVEEGAWYDPAFLRLYEDRGEPLKVEADGFESVDVPMIPASN